MAEGRSDEAAAGDILVVDGDPAVLRRLEQVLVQAGFSVTALSDPERARDQLTNRFFAVALVDLDTPALLGGLELLQFARRASPLSAVFILTPRRTFEAVASAFRAGARDVVPKTEEAMPYLISRVSAAIREIKASHDRDRLLLEVQELHEDFLQEMMALSRQVTDLEDKILRSDGEGSTTSVPSVIEVLVVDDHSSLAGFLSEVLTPEQGWRLRVVQTSGEALDAATQGKPHVLVAKDDLPDLPTTMLIKTIKANVPDLVSLVFRPSAGGQAGEVKMVENSRVITLLPAYSDPQQLLESLEEVREAMRRKAKERRYLGLFRKQHADLLKRYAVLKQRLALPKQG